MTSNTYYSLLNILFFCLIIQENIPNISTNDQCLQPKFQPDQKIEVELFYEAQFENYGDLLCDNIITKCGGLISLVYRMGANVEQNAEGEVTCPNKDCWGDRMYACMYQKAPDKFNENEIKIEHFFEAKNGGIIEIICQVVNKSNGLMSVVNRMGADATVDEQGKLYSCGSVGCTGDRMYACLYQKAKEAYDDCTKDLPSLGDVGAIWLSDCVCAGSPDKIIIDNAAAREKYNIPADMSPTMVVDGKYDPCLDASSFESLKAYFCKAYSNKLPVCQ